MANNMGLPVKKSSATPMLFMISQASLRFLLSTIAVIFMFSECANADYINDEAHQDAKKAIEKFETDIMKFGITGVVIQTIPNCYSKAGSNYRKIRVCGMLDIWAYSMDVAFHEQMSWPRTKGLSKEELRSRMEIALKPLSINEIKEKYGDRDWLDILNETYATMKK